MFKLSYAGKQEEDSWSEDNDNSPSPLKETGKMYARVYSLVSNFILYMYMYVQESPLRRQQPFLVPESPLRRQLGPCLVRVAIAPTHIHTQTNSLQLLRKPMAGNKSQVYMCMYSLG